MISSTSYSILLDPQLLKVQAVEIAFRYRFSIYISLPILPVFSMNGNRNQYWLARFIIVQGHNLTGEHLPPPSKAQQVSSQSLFQACTLRLWGCLVCLCTGYIRRLVIFTSHLFYPIFKIVVVYINIKIKLMLLFLAQL